MKTIIAITLTLIIPIPLYAQSLTWDANTETDMKDYGVYSCEIANCVVSKSAAMFKGYVNHPTVTFPLPVGREGMIAVTARDTALNESGLSVSIPFDGISPRVPVNPRRIP